MLVLVLVTAALCLMARPQWLVAIATQYVEDRRQETRVLEVTDPGEWRTLQAGLEYRRMSLKRKGGWFSSFHLVALRADPVLLSLRIVDIPAVQLPVQDMVTVAQQTGALALMNASYFEPDLKVMGLLVSGGKKLSPLRTGGRIHHGVFLLHRKRAYLKHRTNIDLTDIDEAFQAGPWLVTDGKPQTQFRNADIVTRRSALGVDTKGRVTMAATDSLLGGLSLPEVGRLMGTPEPEGFGCWRAINCDGGTSTQMLLRAPAKRFTIRSSVHVPVYVGVFLPKPEV
jgi:Phosphodiester glycosidase